MVGWAAKLAVLGQGARRRARGGHGVVGRSAGLAALAWRAGRGHGVVGRSAALAALAWGAQPASAAQSSVLVVRDWLPAGVVALALPVPLPAGPGDEAVVEVADLALAAALREAAAGLAARLDASRTRTGRFFVATAAPEDLPRLYMAMRRATERPLPQRHVEAAWAKASRERGFRHGAPEDRHGRIFAARLGLARPVGLDAAPLPAHPTGAANADSALGALLAGAARAPDDAWERRAWVVVSDRERPGLPRSLGGSSEPRTPPDAAPPMPLGPDPSAGSRRLASVRETAEVVTTWVGLAYQLPSGATLGEGEFLRIALDLCVQRSLGSGVYGFSAEIGPRGRLLLEFSAAPDAVRSVEAEIAEALAATSAEGAESELARLWRAANSRRSQLLATPNHLARVAAEALLRGAAPRQAWSLLQSDPVPSPERLAAVAQAARLVVRVELGPP